MSWQDYEAWLQEPEQKALWQLRDKDKQWAYDYCGPQRYLPTSQHSAIYYKQLYEEERERIVEVVGMHDILKANYPPGHRFKVEYPAVMGGIKPELAFMHDSVMMEGQVVEDIPLEYRGCDYDWREDLEYVPGGWDKAFSRVDEYLECSS